MFKQAILVLLFSAFALADVPITGQVFSTNGNPLAYAVIADCTGNNWVIADENGYFNINAPLKSGDVLSVSRYGYQTDFLEISNNAFHTIALLPAPIAGGPIIVSGSNNGFQSNIINTYQKSSATNDTKHLFNQIPGISIRSYGGKAGLLNMSANGNPTVNTKVILGDIDITSAQNGESDLSQIPEELINSISVANSPGIFYGSGAVDGVLKINPQQKNSSISASFGSHGYESINGNYSNNWKQLSANILAGYLKDDGNYKYFINEEEKTRINNDFERKYIATNGIIKLSDKSNFNVFLMESDQKRGATGPITWPSPLARREDKLRLGNVTYNRLNRSGYTKVQLNTRQSKENYDDPNPDWPISSEHLVNGNTLKIRHNQNLWNNILANFLLEGKQENIESSDVGDHKRFSQSLAAELTIPLLDQFKLSPAIRIDKVGDLKLHPTQSLRFTYNGLRHSELEYNIGSGFRAPTFNDLYWNPGGNTDLKPEKSWDQSLKYAYHFNDNYNNNIHFNISDKHTSDLIQWAPTDETFQFWQPQNIASSQRTSISVGSQFILLDIPLQISWHAAYQKTKDIDLNKPLLYAPEVIGFASLNYTYHALSFGVQAHFTGVRIAEYGYNEDIALAGYWYTSATLQYKTELLGNMLSILFDTANIFDKQYMSINGYPEPGRIINFGIRYTLNNQ